MAFNIDNTRVQFSDGTESIIRQVRFSRESDRHAFIAELRLVREGMKDVPGILRFTAEALDGIAGEDLAGKSATVAAKLIERASGFRFEQNFQLTLVVDGSGVVLHEF